MGNVREVPREGSLLPDTYNFTRGFTREQMIQRMQQVQQRLTKEIWERRNADVPLRSSGRPVSFSMIDARMTSCSGERSARWHCAFPNISFVRGAVTLSACPGSSARA